LMDTGLHWLISFYDGLVGYTNSSMFDSHFARAVRGP